MQPSEHWLAQVWQEQWLIGDLRTTDGHWIRIVYRGIWTHRRGPDFADALIDLGGTLLSGDIELHVRSSDWFAHGHHEDPAYDTVVLHAVWYDDLGQPATRRDGRAIPTLELRHFVAAPPHQEMLPATRPLGALGFQYCAPELVTSEPETLHRVLEAAGDQRLRDKVARVHARLVGEAPGQTLYWLLADALGYHRNRDGMRTVAENLPLERIERALFHATHQQRFTIAAALLLGTSGFLPLSDRERSLVKLESATWQAIETQWTSSSRDLVTTTPRWYLSGIRPTNHPLRRLLALASIVSSSERGLLRECIDRIRAARPRAALSRWLLSPPVPIGRDRLLDILVNVIVPFALAYGEMCEDEALYEAGLQLWHTLPSGRGNAITRATLEQICGANQLTIRTARAEQGLLHLYQTGCRPRRCHECPIAHLVLARAQAT
mgnify:FL=1